MRIVNGSKFANLKRGWFVMGEHPAIPLAGPFKTRREALASRKLTPVSAPPEATELEKFRATRSTARVVPEGLRPSDAPASEEYTYEWGGGLWWIRREAEGFVFSWVHPCNEFRPTLAEAEAALLDHIEG